MESNPRPYVHGCSEHESERLYYQASGLSHLLHCDTRYLPGERVLEAACGVGAQTVILAKNSPEAVFVSVDISPGSLALAEDRIRAEGITNVTFQQADVFHLPFMDGWFDHVFVCFLLEHLPDPVLALRELKRVLRPGGTITVIEGDHGSALLYPDSPYAGRIISSLVELQRQMGGNACIGRELWHLMNDAGFAGVRVTPKLVYADESRPDYTEGVKHIFIAMIEGVREEVLCRGLADTGTWEKGIRDLYRTTEQGGSFCYTFFKAIGEKERSGPD
ncbi:MAG: methyltransferase domain-containing protein [Methanoregulaceae archaeon]|nr:methyltransferase domain-containing protein [Methanoregulaceae archaeon]